MKYEIRTRVSPVHTANIALINVKIWDFVCAFYCHFHSACAHFSLRKKIELILALFCANYSLLIFKFNDEWLECAPTESYIKCIEASRRFFFKFDDPIVLCSIALSFSLNNLVRLRLLTRRYYEANREQYNTEKIPGLGIKISVFYDIYHLFFRVSPKNNFCFQSPRKNERTL